MDTIRLYHQDVYLKDFNAQVISADADTIILDKTAFFPEGGGQSCDLGKIDRFDVEYVYEDETCIYHKVNAPHTLKTGDKVSCSIDWKRRFENMQRHCGEHILTGVIYREYGGVNRGFHMGDDYMTIDISMEDDPSYKELTPEMLSEAEYMANEIIWDNIPMISRHYDTLDEAKNEPVRKVVTIEKDITLVGIGSPDNGWSCCACCGTHPSYTGEVGLIKTFRLEPNKGMYRIYFEAGSRAFKDYALKNDIIDILGSRYSAGATDLIDKIDAHENKQKELKNQFLKLRQSVIAEKSELVQSEISDGRIHTYEFDDLSLDDYRNMAKKLDFSASNLVIFFDTKLCTCILFSNGNVDCGKLVKDNASVFSGKGGGKSDNAQAKFNSAENMHLFADAIEKVLR